MTAKNTINTSFIDALGTTLHLRSSGAGPAILLIHQAPTSARTLESRLNNLSDEFLCLAPDLPGNGESDAVSGGLLTIERIAVVFIAMLDRLGIDKVAIYGRHTGALVGIEMALRAPDRISAVLMGGYPIYTPEEAAQRMTSYAPAVPPVSWDGSHLAWIWYRFREQFIYWPWNVKEPRGRASCGIPSPVFLHHGVASIAARHDTYASVYKAAFDYDADDALTRVNVPVHFIIDVADSLSRKVELAVATNPNIKRWHGETAEIEEIERRIFRDVTSGSLPRNADIVDKAASARRQILSWDNGAVAITRVAGKRARPCLMMPAFPAGARSVAAEWPDMPDRNLVLLDMVRLPAENEAESWLAGFAKAIGSAIDGSFDIIAAGDTAALAASLKQHLGARIGETILLDPDINGDGTVFDATICPAGGHLLRLWNRLRMERLQPPSGVPSDPANVRGRYESLVHLGRIGWDAVGNFSLIPAWDRMLAQLPATLTAGEHTRTIFTNIDRRGTFDHATAGNVTLITGMTDAPFRAALEILCDQTTAP